MKEMINQEKAQFSKERNFKIEGNRYTTKPNKGYFSI